MKLKWGCPACLRAASSELAAEATELTCDACGWKRPIPAGDVQQGEARRCLVCGCHDLWRQKDFPPEFGVAIVASGAVLSTVLYAWHLLEWSIGVLMAFALLDMALYVFMPDAAVCYRCHARFRRSGSPRGEEAAPGAFDLEVHERYRQERIRLEQAKSDAATRPPGLG